MLGEAPKTVIAFTGARFYSRALGYETDEETVQQLVFPAFVALAVTDNLSLRIYQAVSSSRLEDDSDLTGLSNTRLRGAFSLFRNRLIIYLGSSLPIAGVTPEEETAYLSELLYKEPLQFGVGRLAEGFDLDSGFAFAQPFGKLSLGFGAGYTLRGGFDRATEGGAVSYDPGNAISATAGFHFLSGITSLRGGVVYIYYGDDSIPGDTFENGNELSFQAATTLRLEPIVFTLLLANTIKGESYAGEEAIEIDNLFTNRLSGGASLAYSLFGDALILKTQAGVKLFTDDGDTSAQTISLGGGFQLVITDNVSLDVLASYIMGDMDFDDTDITGFNLSSLVRFAF